MAATALIQFTQGANTDAAGKAVLGVFSDFSDITVSNGDNTDVVSWTIYLLDAPADSGDWPPGDQPQVLASAIDNTPTVAFSPDVAGTYRVMLEVVDGLDNIDRDIRCFGIPDGQGFVRPPFQQYPEPLPVELPVLITRDPRPVKPDEQNYSDNVRGWAGNGDAQQLDAFLKQHADLPPTLVAVTPYSANLTDSPLHLVDVTTIGAPATFNLTGNPRVGFVSRIAVQGTGFPVTIVPTGIGATIAGAADLTITQGGVFLVHRGGLQWEIVTSLAGGVTPFSSVQYVDGATTGTSPDGTVANPFPTITEAVTAAAAATNAIYLTPGDYSAETLNFTGKQIELIAMAGAPFASAPYLPAITTDSLLTLTNLGQSAGSITSTAFVYLNNTRVDGAITAVALIADAFPDINSLRLLGDPIACDSSIVINGYVVSDSVSSTGGDLSFTDAGFGGAITGLSIVAQGCSFSSSTITIASIASKLIDCTFTGATVITFANDPGVLTVDAATYDVMQSAGVTLVNGTFDVLWGLEGMTRVKYVDVASSSPAADGTSVNPFSTIQAAIDTLPVGSVASTVYIAPGDYAAEALTVGARNLSLVGMQARGSLSIKPVTNIGVINGATGTTRLQGLRAAEVTSDGPVFLTDVAIAGPATVAGEVTWKDSFISGAVICEDLQAENCNFQSSISPVSAFDPIVLTGCEVSGAITSTANVTLVRSTVFGAITAGGGTIRDSRIVGLSSWTPLTYVADSAFEDEVTATQILDASNTTFTNIDITTAAGSRFRTCRWFTLDGVAGFGVDADSFSLGSVVQPGAVPNVFAPRANGFTVAVPVLIAGALGSVVLDMAGSLLADITIGSGVVTNPPVGGVVGGGAVIQSYVSSAGHVTVTFLGPCTGGDDAFDITRI